MRISALVLMLLFARFCVAQNDSTGIIRGVVTDSSTGEPIPFCIVSAGTPQASAQTDINGFFVIPKLPKGLYDLITQAPGYRSDTIRNIIINAQGIHQVRIRLFNPNPDTSSTIVSSPAIARVQSDVPITHIGPIAPVVGRPSKKRLLIVAGTETVLSVGSLIALNQLWYKDYPRTKFHTFNDNAEWLGMDKIGHMQTAYTTGQISFSLLNWSGVGYKKSTWIGGLTGFAYLSAIEIMDGYSGGWGFSTGDMLANASGSALFISQQLIWKEQRIQPKFGFRRSGYAPYRPELLGTSYMEQLIKDYNGQTYWLSFNIASFLNAETKFPQWLNVAVGYGASGMTGGHFNPPMTNAQGNEITIHRHRQYYLSLDIDLRKIKTDSRVLRTIFNTFGFLKIPAPGIELSQNRIRPLLFAF